MDLLTESNPALPGNFKSMKAGDATLWVLVSSSVLFVELGSLRRYTTSDVIGWRFGRVRFCRDSEVVM